MWQIQWLESCESTQHELRERYLRNPELLGSVFATENQTHGHGRKGRLWESPPGNLSFSIIFSVPDVAKAYLINILAAQVLIETLEKFVPHAQFRLKWPNDIWCHNKKLAGLISELLPNSNVVLLGIGLNLNSTKTAFSNGLQKQIITVKDLLGATIAAEPFLKEFVLRFAASLPILHQFGLSHLLPKIHKQLQFLGEEVTLWENDRIVAQGILQGIDDRGQLLVLDDDQAVVKQLAGDLTLRA